MPKIISYTPPWLSRPSPGSQAFTTLPSHDSDPLKRASQLGSPTGQSDPQPYYGPHRLLARRGTEVFVVVENQIRWLDLSMVKHAWEERRHHGGKKSELLEDQGGSQLPPYRVCCNDSSLSPIFRLTQIDSGCSSLSTDTPIDSFSFRQLPCYLDRAYGACGHPARFLTFSSQR